MNQFSVTDFRDLSHGVAVLEQVTGPAAPVRRLLETLRDNTVIYPLLPLAEGLAPVAADNVPDGKRRVFGGRFPVCRNLSSPRASDRPTTRKPCVRSARSMTTPKPCTTTRIPAKPP